MFASLHVSMRELSYKGVPYAPIEMSPLPFLVYN